MFFRRTPLVFASGLSLCGATLLFGSTSFPRSILPVEQPASAQAARAPNTYGRVVRTTLTASELAARMHFDIALKLRNKDELDARLARGEQFSPSGLESYLPAAADYARIRAWLVAQGFTITLDATDRNAIFAEGSNARVAAVFGVTLARVATPDGEFTSAVTAPVLPDAIAGAVAGIRGLQPHLVRHPRSGRASQQLESNGYYAITPAAVAAAYAAPTNLLGDGQTIAVIGASTVINSDLTTFWTDCGISQSLSNVTTVNVGAGPGTSTEDQGEISMDVEWTSGWVPGAKVRLYATAYPLNSDSEAAAYTQILNDLPANPTIHQVTESYCGTEEPFEYDQGDTALPLLTAQGVTCFAASGDGGSNPDTDPTKNSYNSADPLAVSYPASDPYMTGVGGTTLLFPQSLEGQASFPEVAWSVAGTATIGTGGGVSSLFSRPSWQVAAGLPAGNMRCVPDVAALADTGSGDTDMGPIFYQGGKAYIGGGTSLSSPIWAGICAMINQARAISQQGPVGFLNPKLYQANASSNAYFTDITSGSNGAYSAGTGYDLCTGLGTPSVGNLIAYLTTPQVAPSITTQPVSQTVTEGQTATFSVAANGASPLTFQWRLNSSNLNGATSSTLTISPVSPGNAGNYDVVVTNGIGSATSAVAVLTVTPLGPVITSLSPTRQVLTPGQGLNLSVTATGSGTITYQWTHNGRPISGATSDTLSIVQSGLGDSGYYLVNLTDSTGTRLSAPMFVIVAPAATQVFAWGDNVYLPSGLNGIVAITASLGLNADGSVMSWGGNSASPPNIPSGLSNIVAVSGGNLVLQADGTVLTWYLINPISAYTPPELVKVPVVAISAGVTCSLALRPDGTVVAWGDDTVGQKRVPVDLANVVAIAAGYSHELALKSDGTVVAWGDNGYGECTVPAGLTNVVAISAGIGLSIALKADGTVVAWGSLPFNSTFGGVANVSALAAGYADVLTLLADGTVTGVGPNVYGSLNIPTTLNKVIAIAAFNYSGFALRDASGDTAPTVTAQPTSQTVVEEQSAVFTVMASGGTAPLSYQWRKDGTNLSGATSPALTLTNVVPAQAGNYDVVVTDYLGVATSVPATLTVSPVAIIKFQSPNREVLAPGQSFDLSVTATGTGTLSYQWLHNGKPITGASASVLSLSNVSAQSAGYYRVNITDAVGTRHSPLMFVLVAPPNTTVVAWGADLGGVMDVPFGLTNAASIAASGNYSLAVKADGTAASWGNNNSSLIPAGLTDVVAINSTMALRADGTVVGLGTTQGIPAGLTNVVAIAASGNNYAVLIADGTIVEWGNLGNGPAVAPAGLTNVASIAVGPNHTLALKADGTVVAWSDSQNNLGLLNMPAGLTNVVAISASDYNSAALKADGTVVVWGATGNGMEIVPGSLANVTSISLGHAHCLALKSDGTVVAWGNNSFGQTSIPSGLSNVIAIAAGLSDSLALVEAAPWIIVQPAGNVFSPGQSATLSVEVNGVGPFTYQWRKNGVDIAGATSQTLSLSNLRVSDSGTYNFVVTNSIGSQTSSGIILRVGKPVADLNGDGQADILWENSAGVDRAIWYLHGTDIAGFDYLAGVPNEWKIVGTADFNGDGQTDLLWEDTLTGDRSVWLMSGTSIVDFPYLAWVDPSWHIAAVGDFNGDGKPDILWENAESGGVDRAIWFLDGTNISGFGYLAGIPSEWKIVGAADFNGDGQTDIIWENTATGDRSIWLMNGTSISSFAYVANVAPAWHIAMVADFDGDGQPDLLWENRTTGDRAIWLMSGTTHTSSVYLAYVDPVWHIAP